MSSKPRHARILKLQSAIAGAMLSLVLVFTGGNAALQMQESNQVAETTQLIDQRVDFWKVVAGEQAPNSSGVNTRLAVDLREALGGAEASAESLPKAVSEFKAGPNTYGGVEELIGMNPFDNSGRGCDVCGPLSSQMKADLLLIKQGKLDVLLASEQAAAPKDTGIDVTPFSGVAGALFWAAVYTIGTTSALVIAVRRDGKANNYRPNMVRWVSEGGSLDDSYRKISKLLSPAYVYVVVPLSRRFDKTKDLSEVLKETNLGDVDQNIREVEAALRALPESMRNSSEADSLRQLLSDLRTELDAQVHNYDDAFTAKLLGTISGTVDLGLLKRRLDDSQAILDARREAYAVLDGPQVTEQPRGEQRPSAG